MTKPQSDPASAVSAETLRARAETLARNREYYSCYCRDAPVEPLCEDCQQYADHILAELEDVAEDAVAHARAEARAEWQPFETAPKDGADVLLTDGRTYTRVGNWARLREVWAIDALPPVATPTHWLPIPPKPGHA